MLRVILMVLPLGLDTLALSTVLGVLPFAAGRASWPATIRGRLSLQITDGVRKGEVT
jgi:hypothetical protein